VAFLGECSIERVVSGVWNSCAQALGSTPPESERALPRAEVDSLFVDGLIKVTCEFCKTVHSFDRLSIDELFAAA
jgi:hypothetical protein